jgi:hypothetical protein
MRKLILFWVMDRRRLRKVTFEIAFPFLRAPPAISIKAEVPYK